MRVKAEHILYVFMLGFALVFFLGSLRAQTGLPQNWVGSGAGYAPAGSPKATAWVSFATLLNQTAQVYSYSTYDVIPARGSVPMTSARTGLATPLRSLGPIYLFAFGTAGVAQGSVDPIFAFSAGGLALYRFKSGLTVELGARMAKAGNTSVPVYELGFGKSWP